MLANPTWQKIALILNLVGTAVLFYSFQATSSDFRLVTAPFDPNQQRTQAGIVSGGPGSVGDKQYALCVNNFTLVSSDAVSGIRFGYSGCPNWQNARPAAVVSIEHPKFEGLGFFLLISGFALQYFAVPKAATIAYYRSELKKAQLQEKIKRSQGKG